MNNGRVSISSEFIPGHEVILKQGGLVLSSITMLCGVRQYAASTPSTSFFTMLTWAY